MTLRARPWRSTRRLISMTGHARDDGRLLRVRSLVEVVHFRPDDFAAIPRTGFDLYLNIDDGLEYQLPADLILPPGGRSTPTSTSTGAGRRPVV